jgi:hypothetical protein
MKTLLLIILGGLLLTVVSSPLRAATGIALPRGIRNNNPGNIERTRDQWQGMAVPQNDDRYVQFTDVKYGFRAMTRILRNYERRGLTTIKSMISTWAPDTENHTENYINFVSKKLNISPDSELNLSVFMLPLLKAISTFENGQAFENYYSDEQILEGISLA